MLKRMANEITAPTRVSNSTYRYGGEEFVIIADGLSSRDAEALAERIRRRINSVPGGEADKRMTASIGVAVCPHDAIEYHGLFKLAGQRLYRAKAAGRNSVVGETLLPTSELSGPSLVPAG
jgi:diguanylate cyclase (GGDEF)-like protein